MKKYLILLAMVQIAQASTDPDWEQRQIVRCGDPDPLVRAEETPYYRSTSGGTPLRMLQGSSDGMQSPTSPDGIAGELAALRQELAELRQQNESQAKKIKALEKSGASPSSKSDREKVLERRCDMLMDHLVRGTPLPIKMGSKPPEKTDMAVRFRATFEITTSTVSSSSKGGESTKTTVKKTIEKLESAHMDVNMHHVFLLAKDKIKSGKCINWDQMAMQIFCNHMERQGSRNFKRDSLSGSLASSGYISWRPSSFKFLIGSDPLPVQRSAIEDYRYTGFERPLKRVILRHATTENCPTSEYIEIRLDGLVKATPEDFTRFIPSRGSERHWRIIRNFHRYETSYGGGLKPEEGSIYVGTLDAGYEHYIKYGDKEESLPPPDSSVYTIEPGFPKLLRESDLRFIEELISYDYDPWASTEKPTGLRPGARK